MSLPLFRPALLALCCFVAAQAQAGERTIIVLDGSGSMWGQIDGKPKLEIARETLASVLADLPADSELGLMAYGHREKGNCNDIELVVPPGPGNAGAIADAAARMKFLGMTPLGESVTRAARELRFTEHKATVILITDGLETCKADPCAIGQALEESGVDFTAHVVGFGLSDEEGKQVACLAENTGGRYFAADDATGLAKALSETVIEAPAVPPPPPASLEAPEQAVISSRLTIAWDGPDTQADEVQVFDPSANDNDGQLLARRRLRDDPGHAQRQVTLTAPPAPGQYQLRYYEGPHRRILASRPITIVDAEVRLEAPERVAISSPVTVRWAGPAASGDEIRLADAGGERVIDRTPLQADPKFSQNLATVTAPAEPGDYRLEYWNGGARSVSAFRPLVVEAAQFALEAPERAPAAERVSIGWNGPGGIADEVQLLDADGDGKPIHARRLRADPKFNQKQVSLPMPVTPGRYLLRYWDGQNRSVLAERGIEVESGQFALEAPERAASHGRLALRWQGPGSAGDSIQLFDPAADGGAGKVLAYKQLQADPGYGTRTLTLPLPQQAGRFELRYWNGDNRAVLVTRPITLVDE
ncbi:MAG TPA: VWA domain-containing protein [Arenimonas sp.]|nr:VWA domain-containing protein [Arenimonas sp.]